MYELFRWPFSRRKWSFFKEGNLRALEKVTPGITLYLEIFDFNLCMVTNFSRYSSYGWVLPMTIGTSHLRLFKLNL